MFEWKNNLSEPERIQQNIANMTEAKQGSVPYDREIGVFPEWIDKANGMYTAEMLSDLTDTLNSREPRVKSTIEMDDDMLLKVVLEESEEEDE